MTKVGHFHYHIWNAFIVDAGLLGTIEELERQFDKESAWRCLIFLLDAHVTIFNFLFHAEKYMTFAWPKEHDILS